MEYFFFWVNNIWKSGTVNGCYMHTFRTPASFRTLQILMLPSTLTIITSTSTTFVKWESASSFFPTFCFWHLHKETVGKYIHIITSRFQKFPQKHISTIVVYDLLIIIRWDEKQHGLAITRQVHPQLQRMQTDIRETKTGYELLPLTNFYSMST